MIPVMDLQEKVSHFPTRPGVYRMVDEQGRVKLSRKAAIREEGDNGPPEED